MPQHESKMSARDEDDAKASGKPRGDGSRNASSSRADAKDAKDARVDSDGLVKRVIEFFFDNDEFAHAFESFAEENCHAFDLHGDEMKLEYTDIYNQFTALFEEKLEEFIVSQGATVQQFYQRVRAAYDADREASEVLCAQILVATADFDVFVLMMRQTKESMLLAKQ